jgi:hypothetical protein
MECLREQNEVKIMKITRIAKPGKIMPQPPKDPNSGKLDSQIFIGKEDPQQATRKKRKKKKKSSGNADILVTKKKASSDKPQITEYYQDNDTIHKVPKIPGYYLIKEHQMWGYCPTYRSETDKDDVLYYENGKLMQWDELKEYLRENWRPASTEEQDWWVTNLSETKKAKKAFNLKEYIEAKKSPEYNKSPTEHGFFDECVSKNKDKGDPEAYCASIIDKAKGTTKWRGESTSSTKNNYKLTKEAWEEIGKKASWLKESWEEYISPPDPKPQEEYQYMKEQLREFENSMEKCEKCIDVGEERILCDNCKAIEEEIEDLKEKMRAWSRYYDRGRRKAK